MIYIGEIRMQCKNACESYEFKKYQNWKPLVPLLEKRGKFLELRMENSKNTNYWLYYFSKLYLFSFSFLLYVKILLKLLKFNHLSNFVICCYN